MSSLQQIPFCRVLESHLVADGVSPVLSMCHTGGFAEVFERDGRGEESAIVVTDEKEARDTCGINIDQPITARILHYSGE
jgi:hypothetical protein